MKKRKLMIALLVSITLCGCSIHDESKGQQTESVEINEEKQDSEAEESIEVDNNNEIGNATEDEIANQITSEVTAPTKEEVFAAREQVLEGMSEEEIERLKENIKVANLQMEMAYMNDNIFEKLEDADSLSWNYFDAENFIELLEEMKETVKNEKLREDLQQIIDETTLASETHEMEHANNIYRLLHDMDYYLLRYGPEDVGKYVNDVSIIFKYYGVLSVYEE